MHLPMSGSQRPRRWMRCGRVHIVYSWNWGLQYPIKIPHRKLQSVPRNERPSEKTRISIPSLQAHNDVRPGVRLPSDIYMDVRLSKPSQLNSVKWRCPKEKSRIFYTYPQNIFTILSPSSSILSVPHFIFLTPLSLKLIWLSYLFFRWCTLIAVCITWK